MSLSHGAQDAFGYLPLRKWNSIVKRLQFISMRKGKNSLSLFHWQFRIVSLSPTHLIHIVYVSASGCHHWISMHAKPCSTSRIVFDNDVRNEISLARFTTSADKLGNFDAPAHTHTHTHSRTHLAIERESIVSISKRSLKWMGKTLID